MAATEIVIDCTELIRLPINTGIQRVVRSLLRHWPRDEQFATPVVSYLRKDGMARVPQQALEFVLSTPGRNDDPEAAQRQLEALLADNAGSPPPRALHFIPELFYDRFRCDFYQRRLIARHPLAMLAYDFLPFSRPELFSLRTSADLMDYLRLVRQATYVAHISRDTRDDYFSRIRRQPSPAHDTVLPLGADGVTAGTQTWYPGRRGFLVIGTLDRRKNQHLVLEAFEALWQAGYDTPLTLVGRPLANTRLDWIEQARSYPHFRWLDNASDEALVGEMQQARCTIYASEIEGFGLPPIESLYCGVPVIATATLPSVRQVEGDAIVRLDAVTADSIRQAVLTVLDDREAERLWRAAEAMRLPSWADFARDTAAWLTGLAQPAPGNPSAKAA